MKILSTELPQGWQACRDYANNMVYYVNHNTKTTTYVRPPPPNVLPANVLGGATVQARGVHASNDAAYASNDAAYASSNAAYRSNDAGTGGGA
jgi:hypothetical protein